MGRSSQGRPFPHRHLRFWGTPQRFQKSMEVLTVEFMCLGEMQSFSSISYGFHSISVLPWAALRFWCMSFLMMLSEMMVL